MVFGAERGDSLWRVPTLFSRCGVCHPGRPIYQLSRVRFGLHLSLILFSYGQHVLKTIYLVENVRAECPCSYAHMLTCAYVHMLTCACAHMRIYAHMRTCAYAHMRICAYAHMSTCAHAHMCTCAYAHIVFNCFRRFSWVCNYFRCYQWFL